jgi:hypothetical protein
VVCLFVIEEPQRGGRGPLRAVELSGGGGGGYEWPIPVAARFMTWVYGRSLVGIAGSNLAGGHGSLSCECCVLSEVSASG